MYDRIHTTTSFARVQTPQTIGDARCLSPQEGSLVPSADAESITTVSPHCTPDNWPRSSSRVMSPASRNRLHSPTYKQRNVLHCNQSDTADPVDCAKYVATLRLMRMNDTFYAKIYDFIMLLKRSKET